MVQWEEKPRHFHTLVVEDILKVWKEFIILNVSNACVDDKSNLMMNVILLRQPIFNIKIAGIFFSCAYSL